MKKVYLSLMSAMVIFSFANCGKKDEEKQATVDMSAACYLQQTSSQAYGTGACAYNYSAVTGGTFTNYNSTGYYSYTGGLVGGAQGCQGQTSLAYSPTKGAGCVDNRQITFSGQPAVYALSGLGTFVLISTPNPYAQYGQYGQYQQYPQSYVPNYGNGSTAQVYRACEEGEKCPSGQACRQPVPGSVSRIGICYHN